MNTEERLNERCEALENLIEIVKEYYSSVSENQKAFIETIVGAAIFYLPHGNKYWEEKISKTALENIKTKPNEARLTKDHIFPRKLAAEKLLNEDLGLKKDGAVLKKLYNDDIGKFIIVTSKENRALISKQKEHGYGNWKKAYKAAGIELVSFEEVKKVEEEKIIKIILNKAN